jgi:hypothetical protein
LPVYTPEQCEVVIQNQGSPAVITLRPMGLFWVGRGPMTQENGEVVGWLCVNWLWPAGLLSVHLRRCRPVIIALEQ